MSPTACDPCLARSALLARLAGPLDRAGPALGTLLARSDAELIEAVAGRRRDEISRAHAAFDASTARRAVAEAGLEVVCRCDPAYPTALHDLEAPPSTLHVTRSVDGLALLGHATTVAVVGARDASPYGLDIARALGRGLAAAGVTVVSGMARGIDSAAHGGALEAGGRTVAVLAAGAERPYPASARALYRRIASDGAVISELPPGTPARRWTFPARNRLIAALAELTIVVEARPRSGALVTAAAARALGRTLAAVPGHVTSPLACGPHGLLAAGAHLVTSADEVLAALGGSELVRPARNRESKAGEGLPAPRRALYASLADGHPVATALRAAGLGAGDGLAALAALELDGLIHREPGGAWAARLR